MGSLLLSFCQSPQKIFAQDTVGVATILLPHVPFPCVGGMNARAAADRFFHKYNINTVVIKTVSAF